MARNWLRSSNGVTHRLVDGMAHTLCSLVLLDGKRLASPPKVGRCRHCEARAHSKHAPRSHKNAPSGLDGVPGVVRYGPGSRKGV